MTSNKCIVIDHGSDTMKAGCGGEDLPRSVFRSIVGVSASRFPYVGDDAVARQPRLSLMRAVEHGLVTNWIVMEKIWHHALMQQLLVDPEHHDLLLAEPVLTPKLNRERVTSIAFETFGVQAFYSCNQAVLTLVASGDYSGLVLDIGENVTRVVPVDVDFRALPQATRRIELGGHDLTHYLMRQLEQEGTVLATTAERAIVRQIKETVCSHHNNSGPLPFELPDGTTINLERCCNECPDALFDPSRLGKDVPGIHQLVAESIADWRGEIQQPVNIIPCGGSSVFESLSERLADELAKLSTDLPQACQRNPRPHIRRLRAEVKKFSAWVGGSIVAQAPGFNNKWITKAEYDDSGPSVVHSKCPSDAPFGLLNDD